MFLPRVPRKAVTALSLAAVAAALGAPSVCASQESPAPSPMPAASASPAPSPAQASPAANPSPAASPVPWPVGLSDTIEEAIKLLEAREDKKFWETIPLPEDRDRALHGGAIPVEQAARAWRVRGAAELVLRWFKLTRTLPPDVNAEGTEAVFWRPHEESTVIPPRMVFVKKDGRWYLRD